MIVTTTSTIKILLLIFLIIGGIYFGKTFIMPICFGGILAALFLPICQWLERRRIPKAIAVIICVLSLLTIVGSFISLFSWKISELVSHIEEIKSKAIAASDKLHEFIFNQFGITIHDQLRMLKTEQPSYRNLIQNMAGSITGLLANLVLINLYFVFLLYYRGHIKQFLLMLSPAIHRLEMEKIIQNSTKVSQQYLKGLSKMILCLWIMYTIGFSIVGVKNAVFFAILCGLLELIPYLGNILGTFITIFIAALQGGDFALMFSIAIVYVLVQTIQGWLLEPFILGPQVKLNPLFTIIVLILGQLLWGVPGIILAIPLTAMFKIVCDHVESLKQWGFLLGTIATIPKTTYTKSLIRGKNKLCN